MMERTYRGQAVDGTWHEGFLIRSPGVKQNRPGEGWYISAADEKPYAHLVKPMSVGMSTGLQGGNGQTVFEGDILKDVRCGKEVYFAVKYGVYYDFGIKHMGFYAKFTENLPRDVHSLSPHIITAKVVGNVVDTPELMGMSTGKEQ